MNASMREKWRNQIPQNYYCQCLFYMAVLEADFCELKAQLKSEYDGDIFLQTKHYHFERSEVEEDIRYLMAEGERFWEYVAKDQCPPAKLPEI